MPAITSSDVTVTVDNRLLNMGARGLDKTMSVISVTFGDGSLTYPTGGVPLPVKEQFGFKQSIDFCQPQMPSANGFFYKYDATNHKLKIFTQGIVMGSTGVSPSGVGAYVEDSSGSGTSGQPEIPGTSPDETYDMGPMIELPSTIAPASVTVPLLMLGE